MAFIKQAANEPPLEDRRKEGRDCPSLQEQLSNPDPAIRRWAARDIVHCSGVATLLVEHLKIEPDVSVRAVLLTSIMCTNDTVAFEHLTDCLRSEDVVLRNEVVDALKQLPEEAAPIMEKLLQDPDADVRIFAVNVLESLCNPKVEEWLIRVIENDPHLNVCATAVDLLGEVGTKAARGALILLKVRFAHEPFIQFASDVALKRIAGG